MAPSATVTAAEPNSPHLSGPFLVGTGSHCTACGDTLTAVLFFGLPDAVLCCDGCGRIAVHCSCPAPAGHPWAALSDRA